MSAAATNCRRLTRQSDSESEYEPFREDQSDQLGAGLVMARELTEIVDGHSEGQRAG